MIVEYGSSFQSRGLIPVLKQIAFSVVTIMFTIMELGTGLFGIMVRNELRKPAHGDRQHAEL